MGAPVWPQVSSCSQGLIGRNPTVWWDCRFQVEGSAAQIKQGERPSWGPQKSHCEVRGHLMPP